MKTLPLSLLLLTSLRAAVGPDYQRPELNVPAEFRDIWKAAAPSDQLDRGEWWKAFGDATLDSLESRALSANQNLHAAAARVEQARAVAGLARSNYFPSVALDASVTRERYSGTIDNARPQQHATTDRTALDASWELDLFGRVRRLSESARADAEASAVSFEAIRLTLTADVAVNYFSLRALDREAALLASGVALRRRALDLINARRTSGAATDFDVARVETELASTEAEAAALATRRAALQNALAVLVGENAPGFILPALETASAQPLTVPPALPSELLERRPDVAAAERTLAAANARIGVAKAAFFPSISLTGSAGFASNDLDRLAKSDSRLWSIGPSLYLPLFQGGRNRANLARSQAAQEEAAANYRQQVLVAFREVQDALTATRLLAEQSLAQDRALASARRAGELAQTRFDAGYVNLLEVIDAQRTVLAVERTSVQLATQRLANNIALIKALGGGWKAAPLLANNLP